MAIAPQFCHRSGPSVFNLTLAGLRPRDVADLSLRSGRDICRRIKALRGLVLKSAEAVLQQRKLGSPTRMIRFVLLVLPLLLSGCGLAAAPCRVATAGIDIVPLVGHPAATPTRVCANTIDPGG